MVRGSWTRWYLSIASVVSDWRFIEVEFCHTALSLLPAMRLEECMGGGAFEGGVLCNAGDWGQRAKDGDGGQTQGCLTRNIQAQVF